jgi:hypothetical protein
MGKILKSSLVVLALLLAALYLYDYLSIRHRMSAHKDNDPFDTIVYPHILAIPQKGNRVEYALDAVSPMESQSCVHSLFPHFGYSPCWYVKHETQMPTPMVLLLALR